MHVLYPLKSTASQNDRWQGEIIVCYFIKQIYDIVWFYYTCTDVATFIPDFDFFLW